MTKKIFLFYALWLFFVLLVTPDSSLLFADDSSINNCSATMTADLALHVPIVEVDGQYYWANFSYLMNTAELSLNSYGLIEDISPFLSCYPSSLSGYFPSSRLHFPSIIYSGASYWVDFQYVRDNNFTLKDAGENHSLVWTPQCIGTWCICSSLKPKWRPVKPIHTEVGDYGYKNIVVVKFVEGSKIRLLYGRLVSLAGQSLSDVEQILLKHEVLEITRVFTGPEDELDREKYYVDKISCEEHADLNLYYYFWIDPKKTDPETIIDSLNALDIVEIAYPKAIVVPLDPLSRFSP